MNLDNEIHPSGSGEKMDLADILEFLGVSECSYSVVGEIWRQFSQNDHRHARSSLRQKDQFLDLENLKIFFEKVRTHFKLESMAERDLYGKLGVPVMEFNSGSVEIGQTFSVGTFFK